MEWWYKQNCTKKSDVSSQSHFDWTLNNWIHIGMERWIWFWLNLEQLNPYRYGTMGMEQQTNMLFHRYGTGYGTRCSSTCSIPNRFDSWPCHDPLAPSRETPASTHLRVSPTTRQGPKKRNPGGLEHKTKKGRPNHDIDNTNCWELPEYHKPAGPTGPSIRSSPKSKI